MLIERWMKMRSKLVFSLAIGTTILLLTTPTFASAESPLNTSNNANPSTISSSSTVELSLTSHKSGSNNISPLNSTTGNGGTATITIMASNHSVAWKVKPAGLFGSWTFYGDIEELKWNGNSYVYYGEIPLAYGEPIWVGSVSNVDAVPGSAGTSWDYVLTGTATDAEGDTDTVLPGCQAAWTW